MLDKEVNPEGITEADLVVGIPSYNEADAIRHPTTQASEGMTRYFPDKKCVIINCDNASPDRTREVFLNTPTPIPKIYLSTPPSLKGKGHNVKNLFQKATELKAKAVIMVQADLKSITPEWLQHLGLPLFKGFSYVSPLFMRHKYEGTITSGIVYPFTRALYGRRVRQPTGGGFGFNGDLAKLFMENKIWNESVAGFGIDIWMSTLAIHQGVQICQSYLGGPKIHKTMDSLNHLTLLFREIMGAMFSLMGPLESFWTRIKFSKPTAIFGLSSPETEASTKADMHMEHYIQGYYQGFERYRDIWQELLARDLFQKLIETREIKEKLFTFPTDLWARILYEMAIAYHGRICDRDLLLDSLIPLYLGKTFSFIKKTERMSLRQADEIMEEDCMAFELAKPYLVKHWKERILMPS